MNLNNTVQLGDHSNHLAPQFISNQSGSPKASSLNGRPSSTNSRKRLRNPMVRPGTAKPVERPMEYLNSVSIDKAGYKPLNNYQKNLKRPNSSHSRGRSGPTVLQLGIRAQSQNNQYTQSTTQATSFNSTKTPKFTRSIKFNDAFKQATSM